MTVAGFTVMMLFLLMVLYMGKDAFVEQQAVLWLRENVVTKRWMGKVGVDKKPDLKHKLPGNIFLIVNLVKTPHMVIIFELDRSFNLESDAVRRSIVDDLLGREGITYKPVGFYTSEQSIFF